MDVTRGLTKDYISNVYDVMTWKYFHIIGPLILFHLDVIFIWKGDFTTLKNFDKDTELTFVKVRKQLSFCTGDF